jgi:hypothetical protein
MDAGPGRYVDEKIFAGEEVGRRGKRETSNGVME